MSEPSWAEGYVVDIGYTHGYYRELSPSAMRFVSLLGGVRPAHVEGPFVYVELGCGNGHSTALHAAANPEGSFHGVNFNPMHIGHARKLAQDAGIANVRFLEASFAELLETDIPEADYVAMHGVYSWISPENRKHIVEFLRRRLKPGGLVHVSYNCLPGLAQLAPLQRLLMDRASQGAGALPDRMREAFDFAHRLEQAGAAFFPVNPLASSRLTQMAKQDPSYLAHEYFNAHWAPAYHADVAAELAAAKLGYVGSAIVMDNFDQFVLKPEVAKLLAGIGERTMIETLKDFARNQVFRRDLFARGAARAAPVELDAMLGGMRFTLLRPRGLCKLQVTTQAGEVALQPDIHNPVLDALADAPVTFDALAAAAGLAHMSRQQLRQAVFALAALGNVGVALPAAGEADRRAATDRYNAAVHKHALASPVGAMLASPVLGAGIPASFIDLLLLRDTRNRLDAIARTVETLVAGPHKVSKDGKSLDGIEEIRGVVEERARFFFDALLPFLRLNGSAD